MPPRGRGGARKFTAALGQSLTNRSTRPMSGIGPEAAAAGNALWVLTLGPTTAGVADGVICVTTWMNEGWSTGMLRPSGGKGRTSAEG